MTSVRFDRNPAKAALNHRSHGISREAAQSVFYDGFALQFFDGARSDTEERVTMLGTSYAARLLVVVGRERRSGEVVPIIPARKVARSEAEHDRKISSKISSTKAEHSSPNRKARKIVTPRSRSGP